MHVETHHVCPHVRSVQGVAVHSHSFKGYGLPTGPKVGKGLKLPMFVPYETWGWFPTGCISQTHVRGSKLRHSIVAAAVEPAGSWGAPGP